MSLPHKINRVEADILYLFPIILLKLQFLYVKFDQFREIDMLSITFESSNLNILLHICDTYNCDYLPHT